MSESFVQSFRSDLEVFCNDVKFFANIHKHQKDVRAEKVACIAVRVFSGCVMGACVVGLIGSLLTLNPTGIVSSIVSFVLCHEAFKLSKGRQHIMDQPVAALGEVVKETVVNTVVAAWEAIKTGREENKDISKNSLVREICCIQAKGTIFKPIWVELQLWILRSGHNPFPFPFPVGDSEWDID
jgi:hypothetical protein